ncbi:MAG: hypothetical protein M1831_000503 [Alyxoria varia]|nr:MAG: hypothetical protein M1831_000503 [Alyxoria varia]
MASLTVTTRFLILSDTHNLSELPYGGSQHYDVVLHCGDLTEEGHLAEYESALSLLGKIDAELKLVIAGNHDVSLDGDYFSRMGEDVHGKEYRSDTRRKALQLMNGRHALRAGVTFLNEGLHTFALSNGARFTCWATPYTPAFCDWAFAYNGGQEDRFNPAQYATRYAKSIAVDPIPEYPKVDIMMTHGPPLGHLDQTPNGAFLGCRHLQRAVARARPRLHAFGHIHEGRGAEKVTWSGTRPDYDTDASVAAQEPAGTSQDRIDIHLNYGLETLMVNAAIMDGKNNPTNAAWTVDLELPCDT